MQAAMHPFRSQTNFKVRCFFPYENILQSEQSMVVSVPLQANLPSGGKGRTGELPPACRAEHITRAPEPSRGWSRAGHTTNRNKVRAIGSSLCVDVLVHHLTELERIFFSYNIILEFRKIGDSSNVDNFEVAKVGGPPHLNKLACFFKTLQQNQHFCQKKIFKYDIFDKFILSTAVSRDGCSHSPPLVSLV